MQLQGAESGCSFQFIPTQSLIDVAVVTVVAVAVAPHVDLNLGPAVNPRDLEEGDDVYFECHIKAHPPAYKVTWKHNVSKSLAHFYHHIIH